MPITLICLYKACSTLTNMLLYKPSFSAKEKHEAKRAWLTGSKTHNHTVDLLISPVWQATV